MKSIISFFIFLSKLIFTFISAPLSIFDENSEWEIFFISLKIISLQFSLIKPTYLFTVSLEGYLIVIEKSSGNIIRVTDVFKSFKKKTREKIKPVGFIIGSKNIYLTTDSGRLLVIDIKSGKTSSILKIDSDKISRPFILNKNLFVVKDNAVIKLDWCFLNCWKN